MRPAGGPPTAVQPALPPRRELHVDRTAGGHPAGLRTGYFQVPRNGNVDELAEVVGISDNAFSQRLRRGLSNLAYETMVNH
ncbi:helix-turn-helix domain-containing protein [Haloarchaeobius amylolyticus]|uniref:helix-turn-helix domain-containing protein n=1 Tax=Haloarchaeobius amylolyticus TaxID=1198296 RepID=UPI0034A2B213